MSHDYRFEHRDASLSHTPDALVHQFTMQLMEHIERRDFSRGAEIAELLVEMRPESADLWYLLGMCNDRIDRALPALSATKRAVEIDSTHRPAALQLGEMLCKTGKILEGLKLVRAVFDQGRDPKLSPDEQDLVTLRAGAIIEGVQKVMGGLEETQKD